MAYLRNLLTQDKLYLLAHHTFGRRDDIVDTCIPQPEISKIHASIEWNGQYWQVRDLSSNGTWLDERKLTSRADTPLKTAQVLNFANQPHNRWRIENLDAPCNLLLGLNDNTTTEPLSTVHLLPNSEAPLGALYLCTARKQWVLVPFDSDDDANETIVNAYDTIELGEFQWRLLPYAPQQETQLLMTDQGRVADCEFHFDVSLCEEHIQLCLEHNGERVDLKSVV